MITRFPYLFVITYGRSGSTLIQGILNSIPGYCVRGENGGALIPLQSLYESTLMAKKKFAPISKTPADAWYGISDINEQQLLKDIQGLVVNNFIRPPNETRCMGFKEIRYAPQTIGNLSDFLSFMEAVFPGAGFIFNVRSIEQTAKSDWWRYRKDAVEHLTAFHKSMADAYALQAGNALWIEYEGYTTDPTSLANLFEFLGEPFDIKNVTAVLAKRHSAVPTS